MTTSGGGVRALPGCGRVKHGDSKASSEHQQQGYRAGGATINTAAGGGGGAVGWRSVYRRQRQRVMARVFSVPRQCQ